MRRRRFLRAVAVTGCLPLAGCSADVDDLLGPRPAWTYSTGNGWMPRPVVAGDVVYAGGHDKAVHALARDGTRRWRTGTGGAIDRIVGATDRRVVAESDDGDTYGLRRSDGGPAWIDEGTEAREAAALVGGTVYYAEARLPDGSALVARDAGNGEKQWERPLGSEATGERLAVTGETVAVTGPDGDAAALHVVDRSTGERLWRRSNREFTGVTAGSGIVLAGVRPAVGDRGDPKEPRTELHAFDARTGDSLWRRTVKRTRPRSVVARGRAFVPTGRALLALDATTGTRRWRVPFEGGGLSPPVVAGGQVYVQGRGADDGSRVVAALSLDGAERWRTIVDAGDGFGGRLAVAGDAVYYVESEVHVFAAADGARRWGYDPDGSIQWTATMDGFYAGRDDGTLFAIRPG
ncbi:MAG: PQQ-binding-like beta-propeller repeat protein [Haloarculaceae archaeon]